MASGGVQSGQIEIAISAVSFTPDNSSSLRNGEGVIQDAHDTTLYRERSLSGEELREGQTLRPRSRVVSRPRIHIEISDEEVDSDIELEVGGIRSMSVSKPGSRNSVLSEFTEKASNKMRSIVSRQKKRFTYGNYDLDLSYVTNNIIAMGFPSEGAESVYRNKMSTVQNFLEDFHQHRYRVYNLCSEKVYPALKFKNRVGYFPFDDHIAPTLPLIELFCRDVDQWLHQHAQNVAVVHCKAGKGRTGCLVCAYLIYAKLCNTAKDALEFFGAQRTHDGKGVTIPSQIRYVLYTEQVVHSAGLTFLTAPERRLVHVIMYTIPAFDSTGGCNPFFRIICNGDELFTSRKPDEGVPKLRASKQSDVSWNCSIQLHGDVYFEFMDYDRLGGNEVMCGFAFHTAFVAKDNTLVFRREEIDRAHKRTRTFAKDFAVKLKFAELPSTPS